MKKLFLSVSLACVALSIEPAALRQAAPIGLVARAGVLRAAQPVQRALPRASSAASQAVRSVVTLSQSDKSYGKNKTQLLDLAPLVPLAIAATIVGQDMYDVHIRDQFTRESDVLKYVISLPKSERVSYVKAYLEKDFLSGKIIRIFSFTGDTSRLEKRHLYEYLTSEEQKAFSIRVLEKYMDDSDIVYLFNRSNFFTAHFTEMEKKEWIGKLFERHNLANHLHSEFFPLIRRTFSNEEREKMTLNLLRGVNNALVSADEEQIEKIFRFKYFKDYCNYVSSDEQEQIIENIFDKAMEIDFQEHGRPLGLINLMGCFKNKDRKKKWGKLFSEKLNPCTRYLKDDAQGPLCSDFCHRHFHDIADILFGDAVYLWKRDKYNFEELLPEISEYVAAEYAQDRVVYFHGQSSEWVPLVDIYQGLLEIENGHKISSYFIPLRFTDTSALTVEDVNRLVENGLSLCDGTKDREWLLFANLHLFASEEGSNTWQYVTRNYDQSAKSGRFEFFTHLERLLRDHEIKLRNFKEDFEKVKQLYDEAIEEQGNNGRLVVISMPKEVASKISYAAQPGGLINRMTIDGKQTSDPAQIAEHFDQVPYDNEYAICLTDDMLDSEKAQAAGIKMHAFDPAIYWETEKAQNYKAALKDLMARIKASHEVRAK